MADSSSIAALREAIAPADSPEDGSPLVDCVSDSFGALESLHLELTEWQEELTRQQEDFEAQQRAQRESEQTELAAVREELAQLEEENAETLQALEELEKENAVLQAETAELRRKSSELTELLVRQRELDAKHNQEWLSEFRAIRETLNRHSEGWNHDGMEANVSAEPVNFADSDSASDDISAEMTEPAETPPSAAATRAAELRRRAKSRRNGNR